MLVGKHGENMNGFGLRIPRTKVPNMNIGIFGKSVKKKRRTPSFTEKAILWERNNNHICHICTRKIHSLTEAEVDHVRASSKGGSVCKWAHRSCNRMKGNKPLSVIQKRLGIKSAPKKGGIKKRKKKAILNPWAGSLLGSVKFKQLKY